MRSAPESTRDSSASVDGGLEDLTELALDLRNCWNHTTDPIWSKLEPELWSLTHNPWVVLQTASRAKIRVLLADREFRKTVQVLAERARQHLKSAAWFQNTHSDSRLTCVAYFSMEFGLSEALPIYSGGLGNVAGDQLKAASDLGVPLAGVGLLYQQGYFRQVIEADGSQRALYPFNDPGQMPVIPVRDKDGEWFRLRVQLPGQALWLRAWQARVGRVTLYLLDSNDPANAPAFRGITSELYGGGPELRLAQEMVLGIGGWRLLRELGIKPEVCHLNEGHAAFAVLERAASFSEESGQPFDVALTVVRAGNLFTTHTPVATGFDRFAPSLIGQFMKRYAEQRLGIDLARLLALGRQNPNDPDEPFNMAHLAIRGSAAINAVSHLHGAVSRRIFHCLFPRWPEVEVPIGHVTNGVHTPTWDSISADTLWTKACGSERWRGTMETVEADITRVSDADLWHLRTSNRHELVTYVRERLALELARRGTESGAASNVFDRNTLTLGFARRFATYKRPTLLLNDPERLIRILTNRERPVQLVVAGKAHPQDEGGQQMVQKWVRFVQRPEVRRHAVFLSDYDLILAEHLVQGADVWLNTPRRPWEASGTSGMKVLVKGGLNLSELDGWWAEAYSPKLGWPLGDGEEHGDEPSWDAAEAQALYRILEDEIVPAFYNRNHDGIPSAWIGRMRESMSRLTPRFSANRTVREYTETYYLDAAASYCERARDRGAAGVLLQKWEQDMASHWRDVRFGELRVTGSERQRHIFDVQVYLGGLPPDAVRVELYADPLGDELPLRLEMTQSGPIANQVGGYAYHADVSQERPASHYTPRIIPYHPAAYVPLENASILWFR
jgi:starch phosphorylase